MNISGGIFVTIISTICYFRFFEIEKKNWNWKKFIKVTIFNNFLFYGTSLLRRLKEWKEKKVMKKIIKNSKKFFQIIHFKFFFFTFMLWNNLIKFFFQFTFFIFNIWRMKRCLAILVVKKIFLSVANVPHLNRKFSFQIYNFN